MSGGGSFGPETDLGVRTGGRVGNVITGKAVCFAVVPADGGHRPPGQCLTV